HRPHAVGRHRLRIDQHAPVPDKLGGIPARPPPTAAHRVPARLRRRDVGLGGGKPTALIPDIHRRPPRRAPTAVLAISLTASSRDFQQLTETSMLWRWIENIASDPAPKSASRTLVVTWPVTCTTVWAMISSRPMSQIFCSRIRSSVGIA